MPKNNRSGQAAVLTERDYAAIRARLGPTHKLMWDLARYTGERMGAIVRLGVYDVYAQPALSLPRDEITFQARTRKADPTGKRKTRQVPIHPRLREILCAYDPPLLGPLFPNRDGLSITFSAADKALRRAIALAGLTGKGISSHSPRRTLITEMSRQGTDIRTMQQVTGHADVRALLGYVERDDDRVRGAINALWVA